MKYLAVILMPAENDKPYFRLNKLLDQSYNALESARNTDDYVLYRLAIVDTLASAKETVSMFSPENEMMNVPESQAAVNSTPFSHVILELTDEFEKDQPLKDYTARFFTLQPDAYPHYEMGEKLDAVEKKIRDLRVAIKELNSESISLKFELQSALDEEVKLNEEFQELRQQLLEFKGPQFDHANPPQQLPADHFVDIPELFDAVHNNNNADVHPLAGAVPLRRSRSRGFFTDVVMNPVLDEAANASPESPAANIRRHT